MKATCTGQRNVPSHAPPQRLDRGRDIPRELEQSRFERTPLVAFVEIVTELASRRQSCGSLSRWVGRAAGRGLS
jgi:hypothetical protein